MNMWGNKKYARLLLEEWWLDIIGEIIPHSSNQHNYILIATYYFTKWVEEIPIKVANSNDIV